MEVVADAGPDRADDRRARTGRGSRAEPPYSSVRSLIAELRNCVIRYPFAPCSSTPSSPASRARRAPSANAVTVSWICATVIRSQRKPWVGSSLSVELRPVGNSMPGDVALTAAVAELQDELAVERVDGLADRTPEGHVPVVVDHRVVGHDAAAQLHGDERRDDRADAAACELRLPVDARLSCRSRRSCRIDPRRST